MTLITFRRRPSFSLHVPFVLSSRRDLRWLLGVSRVTLDCNEVLSLCGCSKYSWHSCLEQLLADGRALRLTCSPVLLSLHLCYAQAVIQPRRRTGAFLVTARAPFIFPTLYSNSVKRTAWVLQSSCCRRYRIIPNLLSSDYLETDFNKVCMEMVCKFRR